LENEDIQVIIPALKCLGGVLASSDNKLVEWVIDNGYIKVAKKFIGH